MINSIEPFAVKVSGLLLLLSIVLFTGCATVPGDYPGTSSTAFGGYLDTRLGAMIEEEAV